MIEKTTASQFGRWQACVKEFCEHGSENACDGKPLVNGVQPKPPCKYYKGGCKQKEIAECKRRISEEIKMRRCKR